jgi:hypothetical protein
MSTSSRPKSKPEEKQLSLMLASYLFDLFSDPGVGGSMFFRNVGELLLDNTPKAPDDSIYFSTT